MPTSHYIELLKRTLTDYRNIDSYEYHPVEIMEPSWKTAPLFVLHKLLKKVNFGICKIKKVDKNARLNGLDWPANALTMVGMKRLDNIEFCIRSILSNNIAGDFIETGVWRGGSTILMRALLKEMHVTNRNVWLADSFAGLPKPDIKNYPKDKLCDLHKRKILTVSKETVANNFAKFQLLDEQVRFIEGWFKETLPNAPVDKLALLRLDGDLYESTHLALTHLYPKLSVGGYVIIDDYNAFPYCKSAVDDYRNKHSIHTSLKQIDAHSIYWQKA